jgi:hypothetical protein
MGGCDRETRASGVCGGPDISYERMREAA